MKKLMTSTIILLPLIVLAILLVSGAIMSLLTHIWVESVEFVEKGDLFLIMTDEQSPPNERLAVNVFPLEAKNQDLVFEVGDEEIVSVDEDGVLTAKFYGETYVTVQSVENKAASAMRRVIVTDSSVHHLRMREGYDTDMYEGETQQLLYEVFPAEANAAVTWTSSDESVLTVSSNGDVTCYGKGTATITAASVEKPNVVTTAVINGHIALDSVAVDVDSVVTAETTATFPELHATPKDATYTARYTSSDETIAKVDEKGQITFFKEGAVTVTATAVDGRGHEASASVTYNCTYGYFMGPLFEESEYTFDYDEYKDRELAIGLQKVPEGSYREIVDVMFSKEGVIDFDKDSEEFRLKEVADTQKLGLVHVTVKAKKYNISTGLLQEYETDVCDVMITRKATNISFVSESDSEAVGSVTIKQSSVTLKEIASESVGSGIGVLVTPANHTNRLRYEVTTGGDYAKFSGTVLQFSQAGSATVKVIAEDNEGKETTSKTLTVTYTEPQDDDIEIKVNSESSQQAVCLKYHGNEKKDTGVLTITTPEGMETKVVSNHTDVIEVSEENGTRLVPKKGGFATVTVTFTPQEGTVRTVTEPIVCTIDVYVDREVEAKNITFDVEEGKTTSKESLSYTVTLNVSEDAMEGKQLLLDGVGTNLEYKDGKYTCTATKEFGSESSVTLTASVGYDTDETEKFGKTDDEVCSATRRINTTHGKLTSDPEVQQDDTVLNATENTVTIPDIGEKVTLTIDASDSTPEDFELTPDAIKFTVDPYDLAPQCFDYEIKVNGGKKTATVTLTATKGGMEDVTLQIAGRKFHIHIEVKSLANTLEIKYGDKKLEKDVNYKTLLSELELTVIIGRTDGKPITDKQIQYSLTENGNGEQTETAGGNNSCKIGLSLTETTTITLTVKCGKAEPITITIEKKSLSDSDIESALSYQMEYSANGESQKLGAPFKGDSETQTYTFPKTMTGTFSISVSATLDETYLGGFAPQKEDMRTFFDVEGEGWDSVEIDAATKKINVTLPSSKPYFIDEELRFKCGQKTVLLVLTRSNLINVELTGFDSESKSGNMSDVYRGFQQVRVFAKHSYYGDKQVDYFKIPIKALSELAGNTPADPSLITWTLTGYKENSPSGVLTSQRGTKVVYNGETYTITQTEGDGEAILKKDSDIIAQNGKYVEGKSHVPWVDVFSEKGYARIYFGVFKGLSETDVQNDYFGNFGEEEEWKKTPQATDDKSGRTFNPSENAYTFLRVEAGDGAKESEVNAHFNFNVLEDAEVVNVFDATGYCANKKIVLHNNLYGQDELKDDLATQADANDLVLKETDNSKLNKDLLYGNGHQVNYHAKNDALKKEKGDKAGDDGGVTFSSGVYNTVIKGDNPTEKVGRRNQVVCLVAQYAYYCDFQYFSKFITSSNRYLKNTVMRYASYSALDYYWDNLKTYLENVVVVECIRAFSFTKKSGNPTQEIFFKGFCDLLNYYNMTEIGTRLSEGTFLGGLDISKFLVSMKKNNKEDVVKTFDSYTEWFGNSRVALFEKNETKDPTVKEEVKTSVFLNVAAYANHTGPKFHYWNGTSYVDQAPSETGSGSACSTKLKEAVNYQSLTTQRVWTYDCQNSTDGGERQTDGSYTRDMDQLFSDSRYIRLLCQYTHMDEDGTLHKNTDHILWHMQKAYRDVSLIEKREPDHIKALKESLRNKEIKWGDQKADDLLGNASVVALNEMISQAIVPEKREFC